MVATILTNPRHQPPPPQAVDLDPKSTYEVITREKVEMFGNELKEIRYRVNAIFYLVIGTVLLDLILKML